ncbi:unnamed protein product, partial [Mesorhabditis belari]|uniref:Uncharacterized protein n=1 Tax=Mesorhabditis belari TaxID=2138241 RepID=A0AAF3EKQ1_9BILA
MLSIQDIDEGEICYSAKESNKENRSPTREAHYFRSLQSQLDSMPVPNKDLAETPEWMSVQLLPYQQYGLNWMKWRGGNEHWRHFGR